ncbi:hypothetical protein ASE90_16540 [Sphingomonas sp. Leaf67]|uniref:relaxase/mobilization nuclease domain-containing protein n=1 Tax=Sphingomonas sp. Leaf67 TaxID=1736230 RepID=UPI0006F87749|nr:relaxase/mobilization nuclease domain-containing protein [Sphingomonas sp. Leaf67]KQN90715.1 hypothetical protein ASE90_16540 [Sphingomonas sp. Leaf67]
MSGRAVMATDRTSRRVPEAIVRITGRQHGGGHVLANFAYISRLGYGDGKELGLETSEGDALRDGRDMQLLAKEWHDFDMDGDARRKGATSISMILSMPTGTDPKRLKAAALDFAHEEFANRSWVAALHVDRDHPHVHLTIARRDHDGRRFHPNRDDLFRYRQRFAEKLRGRGIEANATPARARGIDPRHESIAVIKMRSKGQVPQLDKSRMLRAQRYRTQGIADPVRAFLAERQATVRATYMRSITELSASPLAADHLVAQSLERFVATMPEPQPNSLRADRAPVDTSKDRADRRTTPMPSRVLNVPPLVDTGIDNLQALHTKIAARSSVTREPLATIGGQGSSTPSVAERIRKVGEGGRGDKGKSNSDRGGTLSDRLREITEKIATPAQPVDLTRASEIIRKAEDRDREKRERDRNRDRDGPNR